MTPQIREKARMIAVQIRAAEGGAYRSEPTADDFRLYGEDRDLIPFLYFLVQALQDERDAALGDAAKVVHEEASEAELCEWGERHAMSVTVRAWLFNAAARIRKLKRDAS